MFVVLFLFVLRALLFVIVTVIARVLALNYLCAVVVILRGRALAFCSCPLLVLLCLLFVRARVLVRVVIGLCSSSVFMCCVPVLARCA